MDLLLGKVTSQAINYAIRSGIAITASYAIRQSNKLLSNAPRSAVKDELYALQQRLHHKIRIISPAIDMIELIAARGNTSLESAISLTKELRLEIQALGQRLASAAQASEQDSRTSQTSAAARSQHELELKGITIDIKTLLSRIEDAIPLINLAITTSGVSLSSNLPHTVSPSRLLQASTFLTTGDTQYAMSPHTAVQIGPTFTLTVYMLFAGHNRPQSEDEIRETTWKEVMHKARVKLRRVPLDVVLNASPGSTPLASSEINSSDEYAYQIMIIEDLDDDRAHDFDDGQAQPGPFEDVPLAGIREMIPIHEISKIFYADTSKVLNIGTDAETNQPVLLLKRDLNAVPPRRTAEQEADEDGTEDNPHSPSLNGTHKLTTAQPDPWRLPPSLDPEWMAFEVYTEAAPDDDLSDDFGDVTDTSLAGIQPTRSLDEHIASMHISSPSPSSSDNYAFTQSQISTATAPPPPPQWQNKIATSLSLLELLLRLTALQQFQQQSHLSITDELLNFFLEESASTGAGGNEAYRQAVRQDARRRVGWDPYDESPVKRRGEEYIQSNGEDGAYDGWSPLQPGSGSRRNSPAPYHNGYDGHRPNGRPSLTGRPSSTSSAGGSRRQSYNDGWIQSGPQTTRTSTPRLAETSMLSPPPSGASPSPLQNKAPKQQWLRRDNSLEQQGPKNRGSPLRPMTGRSDEGLGTSPASVDAQEGPTTRNP
ncbi:Ran-specific GTPase-activating protein 30 [Cyphellophora attinorum]|uniref:Ran-specific GTPase-activating protein 30 n=1 Tax=Cyphellophora attinorum TaxID=1664694 RepID=A0A0N1HI07_9EURO|nr:Ran-specific GTPase-activating protein 30 [Phialophora attinorum]KPI45833.1 Ran-specific GTPase-activating protein 30 [Phialophora attinorum]